MIVLDVIGAVLVICGALLGLLAAIGLLRLPDVLSRMHAATKPQTLGLLVVLTGLAFTLRDWRIGGILLVIAMLQLLTAPISAHLVARTAYRSRQFRTDLTEPDELDDDLAEAGFELRASENDDDDLPPHWQAREERD